MARLNVFLSGVNYKNLLIVVDIAYISVRLFANYFDIAANLTNVIRLLSNVKQADGRIAIYKQSIT